MPIFDFECHDCKHMQEHFIMSLKSYELNCPKCSSKEYNKMLSVCKTNIEYSDPQESYEKKIKPHVDATYAAMGREALSDSTKTAEDMFGSNKVEGALGG